jgi:peptidoglycan/xylan/chitin deacetylase (PgdA/CDA1 family)
MPQAWIDALNVAVQANKIPNIAPSVQNTPAANPVYNGVSATDPSVCSGSYGCRVPGDIYDAPAGVMGLGFDDGPLAPSDNLYAFLKQNEIKATHFYIGINIIANWNEFNTAFQTNQDDIAVHTWTHPYMTTLSNEDVVAQLGWTLQLIYNSTGGRLCRFWRPPYGDTDMRVSAIAKEVFGLTAIIWNQDTGDWALGTQGGPTTQSIQTNFQNWLSGPQTTGLIILEHELSDAAVQCFMAAYPLIKQYNWDLKSVASIDGKGAYQNAPDDTSSPVPIPLTAAGNGGAGLIAAMSTSTSTTPPPPSPTSSASSKQSAHPGSGVKTGGALGSKSSPIMLSVSTLALVFSLCLI